MQSMNRQCGMGFLSWMVVIAVLGFGVVVGFRLAPIYLQAYTIDTILEDVAKDSAGKKRSKKQLWDAISKRLDINGVQGIKKENFSFTRDNGKTTIGIKYEVRTKLVGNIDGLVHFDFSQTFES